MSAQEQMDRALSQSLSPAEGELAEADLEQLEADYARLEAAEQLPSVPSVGSSNCCQFALSKPAPLW